MLTLALYIDWYRFHATVSLLNKLTRLKLDSSNTATHSIQCSALSTFAILLVISFLSGQYFMSLAWLQMWIKLIDKLFCRLVYTTAFIQEVHRFYSIVPMAGPRSLQKDTVIDGYLVPKGTTILMSLRDMYFDPELFEDPHVFRPERFIDESGMLKNSEHMYHFGLGGCQVVGLFKRSILFCLRFFWILWANDFSSDLCNV